MSKLKPGETLSLDAASIASVDAPDLVTTELDGDCPCNKNATVRMTRPMIGDKIGSTRGFRNGI